MICTECKGFRQKSQLHELHLTDNRAGIQSISLLFRTRNLNKMNTASLPLPEFYDPGTVGSVWRVSYEERARQARDWAHQHALQPVSFDPTKTWLMLIDVQNTFCIPGFELYVGGRSGRGAVEDNVRLSEFIYHNLGSLTHITATIDTHMTMQVFHAIFFVD